MNLASERSVVEKILRSGMVLSMLLLLAGLLGATASEATRTTAVPLFSLFTVAGRGDVGAWFAALGILVLAATPVLRVVALAWIWGREHDGRFMWVALTVTAILACAILGGRGG